ncbi:MAG: Asp-tRNA(Asn)/Glu-tRNA(Gln) amidotransferase subunit GatB [Ferruginibacter sp.]
MLLYLRVGLSTFAVVINREKYELVVGLEVHAQLLTSSKIFCGDSTSFDAPPNTQVSPVSLGHPGTLPVMNIKAIEFAIKAGLALHCKIEQQHYFARKNYFYPDLPKGYQVTQHTAPVCTGGYLSIYDKGTEKKVRLNRIHLEEDAGKSIHDIDPGFTCIDVNRAGVPLIEIVSEPDLRSAEEAYQFLTELRRILRWIEVCDGNMEEGSMRCDANISIRIRGVKELGTRVEIKNLNSIRNVKKAIESEFNRLITLTENNEAVKQETRSYNADNDTTFSLRSKEEEDDYRYFPEPDLPSFFVSEKEIREVEALMPLLPDQLKKKYTDVFLLNEYDSSVLLSDKETADFYEEIILRTTNYKATANWVLGPVKSYCNENNISVNLFPVSTAGFAELIELTENGQVSFTTASTRILQELISDPSKSAITVARQLNLLQESDKETVEAWIDTAIASMPEKLIAYRNGKKNLLGLFAGEVKKLSKGRADMQLVNILLTEKLKT